MHYPSTNRIVKSKGTIITTKKLKIERIYEKALVIMSAAIKS